MRNQFFDNSKSRKPRYNVRLPNGNPTIRRLRKKMAWINIAYAAYKYFTTEPAVKYAGYVKKTDCGRTPMGGYSAGTVNCATVGNFTIGNANNTRTQWHSYIRNQIFAEFQEYAVLPHPTAPNSLEQWLPAQSWMKLAGAKTLVTIPQTQRFPAIPLHAPGMIALRSTLASDPSLDPNMRRKLNPGRGQPLKRLATGTEPPSEWIFKLALRRGPKAAPAPVSPPKGGWRPSSPPKAGTKEAPKQRAAASLGARLFKALDQVSESAEIVDALWRAIPKELRSKGPGDRGLIDTAGQYGIDGADWKLGDIWKHFDKIDWEQFVRNVIANQVEDAIIGRTQGTIRNAYRGPDATGGEFGMAVSEGVGTVFGAN